MIPKNVKDGSTRRRFLQGGAMVIGGIALGGSSRSLSSIAFAQNPPNCPPHPVGGTPFSPGSDKRPIVLRKSISNLSAAELTQLQTAFAMLRALPPTDVRTWVLQADVHAAYCMNCNSDPTTQIHFSWNFFPWHRAFLYYYERILGSLVGDINNFRLPYWDWENHRRMPGPYLSPANSGNSLYDANRWSVIASGGALPVKDGSATRVNFLLGITDFATFGGAGPVPNTNNGDMGAVEGDPHGIIHIDLGIGGPGSMDSIDMGDLGYAARDPIFFSHHANLDKIWAQWNSQSGTGTDYQNPTDPKFLNARWSFYDENQNLASISASDVLNYKGNLRYTYTPLPFIVPPFELRFPYSLLCCLPGPDPGPYLHTNNPEAVQEILRLTAAGSSAALVLSGVKIPQGVTGTFDVAAVRRDPAVPNAGITVIGALSIVGPHSPPGFVTLVLDITKAVPDLLATPNPATILLQARPGNTAKPFFLQAQSVEIRLTEPNT